MIVLNAQSQQQGRRTMPMKAAFFGLAAGLLSALSVVDAAPPAAAQPVATAPAAASGAAQQTPAGITSIDFKRGDGGSGKLILHFDADGAMPDLRALGSGVIVDIGNASLPAHLQRTLNVSDFATPAQQIQATMVGNKAQVAISAAGAFEPMAYQTGRDYIVELVPKASAGRAVGGSATAPAIAQRAASSTSGNRQFTGRPVTFNFQDVPVRTVLQLIGEESNLNIVAADTVQGNLTLRLIGVPWDQALEIVLQAKQLDKRRNGNVIWVAPQAEIAKFEQDKEDARIAIENRAETVTEYIPVSYGNAEDIAKLLTDESKTGQSGGGAGTGGGSGGQQQSRGFLSQRGSLSFDRRTNTLLVIDIPARVAEIRRLVAQLDKPVDQVLIEAKIVIATEDFARELGAKFGINGYKDNVTFGNNIGNTGATRNSIIGADRQNAQDIRQWQIDNAERAAQGLPPLPAPVGTAPTISTGPNVDLGAAVGSLITSNPASLAFTILNAGYYLDIELSAMQEEGRGEVISNPRVVTSNQREAVIKQGREIGYVTTSSSGGIITQTVNFKDVVLELKVTPTITNDGRVFLNMAVKKDELEEFISTVNGSVPLIAKREVNTAVLVEDGNTVVIGGVYEFSDRSQASKVPFLADLPILGNLFKKKGRGKTKAELLIFVTPKVMAVAPRRV